MKKTRNVCYIVLMVIITSIFSSIVLNVSAVAPINSVDTILYENDCETLPESVDGVELLTGGGADGSNAHSITKDAFYVKLSEGTKEEVLIEFDLRFDEIDDNGRSTGSIRFIDTDRRVVGPIIYLRNGYLGNQISSNAFLALGSAQKNKWYHFEFKGYMSDDENAVGLFFDMKVYEWVDGSTIPLFNAEILNYRSSNLVGRYGFGGIEFSGSGISVDNFRIVKISPDELTLSSSESLEDELLPGDSLQFTYTALHLGEKMILFDKDVTWSIYDADNIEPISDSTITIENGLLKTSSNTKTQDITVRATVAETGVSGSIPIKINSSDDISVYVNDNVYENGYYKIQYQVVNNKQEDISYDVFIAAYDEDGRLIDLLHKVDILEKMDSKLYEDNIQAEENTIIKLMLWDKGMKPLIKMVEIT